jgi:hypothetical protein
VSIYWGALVGIIVKAFFADPAQGQEVRTCYGTDNCTVVSPQGHRQLSVEEARNHAREQVRNALSWQVLGNCDVAIDPTHCRELVQELQAQFGARP